jgi:hypothetical protein
VLSAVVLPISPAPTRVIRTRALASAVPERISVPSRVILSVLLAPLSSAMAVITGLAGGVMSTTTSNTDEDTPRFPAASVAVPVKLWVPSGNVVPA